MTDILAIVASFFNVLVSLAKTLGLGEDVIASIENIANTINSKLETEE